MLDTSDLSHDTFIPSMGSIVTSVNVSTASTLVLGINDRRKSYILYNAGAENCYMKLGLGASYSSFSYTLRPGRMFYMDHYGGIVSCICSLVGTTVQCTEVV